jgi:hypothetical protein
MGSVHLKLRWVPIFFGAKLGAVNNIHLIQIDGNGKTLSSHNAAEIYKDNSKNWAFEIPGANNLTFPGKNRRPILIIAQTASGKYPYELVMPGEPAYPAVRTFLYGHRQTPAREMARCIVHRNKIPAGCFGLNF